MQLAEMPNSPYRKSRRNHLQVCSLVTFASLVYMTNYSQSHVFCSPCSDSLGLTAAAGGHRMCPACQTVLTQPDDAVSTSLVPTDDYKTSVLSGLSPSIIMECAGRGLAFWSYQSTQEMYAGRNHNSFNALTTRSVYQEYLAKTLTEKYTGLNMQMDKIINDANSELNMLNQKLNSEDCCSLRGQL